MSDQLHLLDESPRWRLDPATRERGRNGVAQARAILQQARVKTRVRQLDQVRADAPSSPLADAA